MTEGDPWIGQTLSDRYEISGRIGQGGMSTVYRAWDARLGREVAIKMFAVGAASDDERRQAEVKVLARLGSPGLVSMFDAHLEPEGSSSASYLVMELVDGPDLSVELAQGVLPGPLTAAIARDVAEALVTVHANGVIHRDLKPANILLADTGLPSPPRRAKLVDFGIAHLVGDNRLTEAGTVVGTAAYLSPEQASGEQPGPESDIYSLGLVLLECLTGRRAYPGTMMEAMNARAVNDPAIPDDLPPGWLSLLAQMTSRDPKLRPTAVDVAVAARQLAPELDGWVARPPGQLSDPDAATLAATLLLPQATSAAATSATVRNGTIVDAATPPRASRRRLIGVVLAVALVLGLVSLATVPMLTGSAGAPSPSTSTTPRPARTAVPVSTVAPQPSTTPVATTPKPTTAPPKTPPKGTPPGHSGKPPGHKKHK